VIESVDGVAVTPAGSPLRETAIGSAKPLTAAAVMVSVRAEPPLCRGMELGAAVIVKSGTGAREIVRAAVAVWESGPAEAVTVTIVDVAAAESEAVRVNCANCPGVTERVEGVAVTPAGRPLSETLTGVAKPLTGAAVTVSDRAEPPLCRATAVGAAAIVKLGAGPDEPHPRTRADVPSNNRARRRFLIGDPVRNANSLDFSHTAVRCCENSSFYDMIGYISTL
jgi:hypothetical protein